MHFSCWHRFCRNSFSKRWSVSGLCRGRCWASSSPIRSASTSGRTTSSCDSRSPSVHPYKRYTFMWKSFNNFAKTGFAVTDRMGDHYSARFLPLYCAHIYILLFVGLWQADGRYQGQCIVEEQRQLYPEFEHFPQKGQYGDWLKPGGNEISALH